MKGGPQSTQWATLVPTISWSSVCDVHFTMSCVIGNIAVPREYIERNISIRAFVRDLWLPSVFQEPGPLA